MEFNNVQSILDAAPEPQLDSINVHQLETGMIPVMFVPNGYTAKPMPELEKHLPAPLRKVAQVALTDAESFIGYVREHGLQGATHIYLDADYAKGRVAFTGIINDHQATSGEGDGAAWRDHRATFEPAKSLEWQRWKEYDRKPMGQLEFATFIEDNMADIAQVPGLPSASDMLGMALTFEATCDKRFKSATRIQSGGVNLEYVDTEDDATRAKMQIFERFAIGVPVFAQAIAQPAEDGAPTVAYRIDARLKYRIRDGELKLWYELVRPDKVLQAASQDLVKKIQAQAGFPLLAGNPFAA